MQTSRLKQRILDAEEFVRQLDPTIRQKAFELLVSSMASSEALQEEQRSRDTSPAPGPRDLAREKEVSINELVSILGLKTNRDVAVAIGYFYERVEDKDSFDSADIEEGFRKTKRALPKNPSDLMLKNVQRGLFRVLDDSGKLNAYDLTQTGIEFVEKRLEQVRSVEREEGE